MGSPRIVASLAILILTSDALVGGQAGQQAPPVFRSSTAHVTLDVVVTDRNDRPIMDLTLAEFEVKQSGRVQTLDQFEAVRTPLVDRAVAVGAAFDVAPVSNAHPQPDARAFSFVIDEGTLLPEDIVPTKAVMRQFIRRLPPVDRVSATYVGRSDLSQDFTHDPARLDASIDRFAESLGSGASFDDPSNPVKGGDDLAVVFVLREIVTALSSVPETRRAIVLVSRGTYPKYLRNRPVWQAFYQEAERRGVPVYTIDPSGIAAPELGLQLSLENQTPENRQGLDNTRRRAQANLREVAANTGGRALVNKGTVLDSVDQIVTENGSYYVIGFTPDRQPAAGKFQEVDVRVTRPGARVRSRRGYVVPSDASALSSPKALARNLELATPGGDLPASADMAIIGRSSSGWEAIVTVDVTLPAPSDYRNSGDELSVAWIALSPDGKVLNTQTRSVPISRGSSVASIVERLTLHPGARTFRIAVSSAKQQTVARVHLAVPEIVTRETGSAGSLVVGVAGREGVSLTMFGDPSKVLPFLPTTLREVSSSHVLQFWCRVATADIRTATMVLAGPEGVVRPLEVRHQPLFGARSVDLTSELLVKGLAHGRYTLRLAAVPSSGVEVIRTASFQVR